MVVGDEHSELGADAGSRGEVNGVERAQHRGADVHGERSYRVDRKELQAGEDSGCQRRGTRA